MMRTYRGIVCEKKNKYMVFLTNEGEFLRGVPIGKIPDIGDEADFKLAPSYSGKVKSLFVGVSLAAAMFLFFILASMFPMNNQVKAYVQLETDTAVELGIDRHGNVITVRYLNERQSESEHSLMKWEGHPLQTVLSSVIQSETSENQVTLTTVFPNSISESKVQEIVGSAVHNVRSAHNELTWHIFESTKKERATANKHKMSIHKLKRANEGAPMKEKNSPSKIGNQQKTDPVVPPNEKEPGMHSEKQSVPPSTPSQKNKEKDQVEDVKKQRDLKRHEKRKNQELNSNSNSMPEEAPEKGSNAANQNRGKNKENPASKQQVENPSQPKKGSPPHGGNPPNNGKEGK